MTGPTPASGSGRPGGDDLTARVFRALYQAYDLYSVAGIHVAVPAGSPCFAGPTLGAIARQISYHEDPDPPAASPMAATPLPPRRPRPARAARRDHIAATPPAATTTGPALPPGPASALLAADRRNR